MRFAAAATAVRAFPEIMKDAGLTHGGFYAHFASREAMLADPRLSDAVREAVLQHLTPTDY